MQLYVCISVHGQIRTTVGQAMLLMDQRFKQFSGLIDNCEFKLGEKETTCMDLKGFWEMIYYQVCVKHFNHLSFGIFPKKLYVVLILL
jgi:disks large-associated protein 5